MKIEQDTPKNDHNLLLFIQRMIVFVVLLCAMVSIVAAWHYWHVDGAIACLLGFITFLAILGLGEKLVDSTR
jgi:F0F1-type ATP synthase assembly protein I